MTRFSRLVPGGARKKGMKGCEISGGNEFLGECPQFVALLTGVVPYVIIHNNSRAWCSKTLWDGSGNKTMKKLLIIGAAAIAVYGMCFTASAEDGYIESEGDAFISLGHCAGPNTKIAVDLQMTELTFNTFPFGSYGNNKTKDCFELYISHGGDEKPRFSFEYSEAGGRCAHNCNYANLERWILAYDAHAQMYSATNVTSGGALLTQSFSDKTPPTETSACPISLFGGCYQKYAAQTNHFVGAAKMKVYGVKIW